MSDLISKEWLIESVEEGWIEFDTQEDYNRIIHLVRDIAPSAQPKWIPVKEMLLEVNGRYLVTRGLMAAGALWNRVYIANYSDLMGIKSEKIWWQGNVGKSDFERLDDVVSWMPLPEP